MEEPDLLHFQSIPWCSTLLSDQSLKPTPTLSRQPKPSTEDSLFAETLKTSNTISHIISLYKIPTAPSDFITELHMLVTLGSGMNGGPGVLHGGIISTLIDDAMGTLLNVNKHIQKQTEDEGTVTANLEIRFLKPVKTPTTLVVSAVCEERTERKFWLRAVMKEADGLELATARALWVRFNRKMLKL